MKGSIKISLAVAAGAAGALGAFGGSILMLSDWRPFAASAAQQALERRVQEMEAVTGILPPTTPHLPKVVKVGNGGA